MTRGSQRSLGSALFPSASFVALLAVLLLPAAALAVQVTFALVRPDRSHARAGTIYLYREGSTRLAQEVSTGSASEIPPGRWWWVAVTPGYVSVDSATHQIGGSKGEATPHFVIPVVPACTLTLTPDRRWKTVVKIAIFSLHYGSLYPLDPNGKRKSVVVPEGGYVVYAVGPHGRNQLAAPASCHAFETKPLSYP